MPPTASSPTPATPAAPASTGGVSSPRPSMQPQTSSSSLPADPSAAFTVILFGWADGEPAHIAKYQAAYPVGCDFHIYPSAVWDVGRDPATLIHRADRAIDFLTTHGHLSGSPAGSFSSTTRGLILHAFSNGGIQSLATLLAHLSSTGSHLTRLRALIVDCAPTPTAQRAIGNGADLFSYSLGLGPLPTALARGVFFTALSIQAIVGKVFGARPQLNKNRDMLLAHRELQEVPKLLLYTPGDRFIDYKHIEWLVGRLVAPMRVGSLAVGGGELDRFRVTTAVQGEQEVTSVSVASDADPSEVIARIPDRSNVGGANGGLVAAVRFPKDARHVQLLRGYPKQYVRVVGAFLSKL